MYKSLLPQFCVNNGFYYSSTCTSPFCHSAVSIRFFTTPLHVQVNTLLPQCCVNNGFYYSSTCTSLYCHSAVSIRFRQPLHMYKSLLPQCCVNKVFYYPSTCTSPYCHSAVSIMFFTTPLHVQVLAATVLCQ